MNNGEAASWGELYDGGSRQAEEAKFLALAQELLKVQEINRQKSGGDAMRTFHAKMVAMAKILEQSTNVAIYAGSGCADAHDEVVQLAARLKAPVAHTSRGKDALEWDNPYNVGMTGVLGMEAGYTAR